MESVVAAFKSRERCSWESVFEGSNSTLSTQKRRNSTCLGWDRPGVYRDVDPSPTGAACKPHRARRSCGPARGVFQLSCVRCGRGSLSTSVMSVKIGDTVSLRLTPRIPGCALLRLAPGWQEPLNESHRMMMRSLAYLDGRVRDGKAGTVTVDRARPSQHRECGRDRNVQERTAAPVRDNLILSGP